VPAGEPIPLSVLALDWRRRLAVGITIYLSAVSRSSMMIWAVGVFAVPMLPVCLESRLPPDSEPVNSRNATNSRRLRLTGSGGPHCLKVWRGIRFRLACCRLWR
jgi:hypothetical protein